MKTRDFLFGGPDKPTRRRRTPAMSGEPQAPLIGIRFILVVATFGMIFSLLGFWRVQTVFTARDYEIETSRLQEIARQRRDRETVLVARTSQLQRGEILRTAAENSLGMTDPDPRAIETLMIPAEVTARWNAAANALNEQLSREKEDTATN